MTTLGLCRVVVPLLAIAACRGREQAAEPHDPGPPPAPRQGLHQAELDRLFAFEERHRASLDFATLAPSDTALGPDPYRIERAGAGFVGLLRGESAVVSLDATGAERSRVPAPRSPSGLAVSADGTDVLVVGEAARELAHYRLRDGRLERAATIAVDALGLRDVALAPDGKTAYLVEELAGRVLAVTLARGADRALRKTAERELGRCHGPVQVEALAELVAVNCLLDRTLELHRSGAEVARIRHEGPLWSLALHRAPDGTTLLAAGGVEDHALVREDGGFGYIDSFVYLYRVPATPGDPARLAAVNTSALGLVTPKHVALATGGDTVTLTAIGFATPAVASLTWRGGDFAATPQVASTDAVPGIAAAALADDGTLLGADPLFDAWVVHRGSSTRLAPVASERPARALPSRVGELLFFTSLMAPWNGHEGKLSRFTCETCHHEGYVDGRTHFTGRETEGHKVHATTRPLYGLFNNAPHFSRALDKSTTQMVHSEFRVANRFNGRDPWFALSRADVPWLAHVAGAPESLSAELLRECLMTFLADFTHRANPRALGRDRFTDVERTGAQVFRDRCAACHAARLVADEPRTQVAFERWESLVLSPTGGLVWSDAAYAKTNVTPYVHAEGTRTPSLRRLYKKWPYFTTGSAKSLDDVLARFASDAKAAYHEGAPAGVPGLSADEQRALRAFLELL